MDDNDIIKKCNEIVTCVKDKYQLTDEQSSQIYLAGGCVRSMVLGEEVKDYDIFIETDELKDELITEAKLRGYYVSDNAITHYTSLGQIQIITTVTGKPWDIVNEFDFVMNQNYYSPALNIHEVCNGLYIADRDVISAKRLTINQNCRNKLGTLARLSKFLERGYNAPSKTDLLSLGIAISKLNPVNTLTELKDESKLFLSSDDCYELMDNQSIEMCTDDEIKALNNRGSGL